MCFGRRRPANLDRIISPAGPGLHECDRRSSGRRAHWQSWRAKQARSLGTRAIALPGPAFRGVPEPPGRRVAETLRADHTQPSYLSSPGQRIRTPQRLRPPMVRQDSEVVRAGAVNGISNRRSAPRSPSARTRRPTGSRTVFRDHLRIGNLCQNDPSGLVRGTASTSPQPSLGGVRLSKGPSRCRQPTDRRSAQHAAVRDEYLCIAVLPG
jgi:hypothetical protein